MLRIQNCQRILSKIHDAVKGSLAEGKLPITIGGDHSIGTATVSASLVHDPSTCVVWVDAHADINTPKPLIQAIYTVVH